MRKKEGLPQVGWIETRKYLNRREPVRQGCLECKGRIVTLWISKKNISEETLKCRRVKILEETSSIGHSEDWGFETDEMTV